MTLRNDITAAINRHSAENPSNTPDFILGRYLERCLLAYDEAVVERERWYGRAPQVLATAPLPPPEAPTA